MKKLIASAACLCLIASAVYVSRAVQPGSSDDAARVAALKLFQSLSDEQKQLAVKDFADKDRYTEQFPEVKRPGLPFANLSKEQRGLLDDVIKAATSEYGAKILLEVAKQSSEKGRYVNFFGAPSMDKPFAWRFASHHLTLIYAEFGKDKANEFGPILLGGNPVKDLWSQEEKLALELYAALSEDEKKSIQAKGIGAGSGGAIGKAGVRIGDLNDKARPLAAKLLAKRLDVFSAERRKVADAMVARDGGVDNLRIAFWNAAEKSHLDGGNYHWRIGSDNFIADWQTAGKNHIHMTLRARAKKA
jgi:hypothetical protein